MITCKEDLLKTKLYLPDAPVPRHKAIATFYDACKKFDIKVMSGNSRDYFMVSVGDNLDWLCIGLDGNAFGREFLDESSKYGTDETSMSDFSVLTFKELFESLDENKEPRTKPSYEKVEFESTGSAYRAMLDGDKLYNHDGSSEFLFDGKNFIGIGDDGAVYTLECHSDKEPFYRKVEKPIEWWEDAAEYINTIDGEDKAEVEMFGKGLNKEHAQAAAVLMLDESHALEILENKYGADVIGKVAILLEQGE